MEHYYTKKPISDFRPSSYEVNVLGEPLTIHSGSGIFSIQHLDKGSELLIKRAVIESGWKVLDLGCGYGVVGIAIAKHYLSTQVHFTDINERAVMLTKKNIKANKIEGTVVSSGDGLDHIDEIFDTILLNPPQNAGKKVVLRLFEQSKDHLKPGGLLQIVARHSKGGKDLKNHLLQLFGNCADDQKQSGFRIYVCKKE